MQFLHIFGIYWPLSDVPEVAVKLIESFIQQMNCTQFIKRVSERIYEITGYFWKRVLLFEQHNGLFLAVGSVQNLYLLLK